MEKIKVGVIGVGNLGQHHARIYANSPNAQLIGVADINEERASFIGKKFNTVFYTDYNQLVPDVQAVSIAVPTYLHHKVAKDCLMAGIHVLVEKPITIKLEEAEELLLIAKDKGLILQVGHIERFNSAILQLEKFKKHGPQIIEAHRFGPFNPGTADVGVVLDLMIHDIDIILNIVNSPIRKISAIGMSILSPFEDVASARIQFENGSVATIIASRITREKARSTMIFQKDQFIDINYMLQDITIYRKDPNIHNDSDPQSSIIKEKLEFLKEEPLKLQLEDFIECVQKGEEPIVSGKLGKQALEVALEILKVIEPK